MTALLLLAACAVTACQSDEISLTDEQRYFASAANQENRLRSYAERYQRAAAKAASFESEVVAAEVRLSKMLAELTVARTQKDEFAKELVALNEERLKIQEDVTLAKLSLTTTQQDLSKLQGEVAEVALNKASEDGKRKEMVDKLEEARRLNEKSAERVTALLKELADE